MSPLSPGRLAVVSPAAARVMFAQPQPDYTMALRGLLSRTVSHRTFVVPMVSLTTAARSVCRPAVGPSMTPTVLDRQEVAMHSFSARPSPSRADWRSPHGGGATACSAVAMTQSAQLPRRPHADEPARTLATVSSVTQHTRRPNGAAPVTGDSEAAAADLASTQSPSAASECEPLDSAPPAAESSAFITGGGHGGSTMDAASADAPGRTAGAFQRLPMVQLAKEQLSTAQRAARRTPYSRKLKNEAQRERNRCAAESIMTAVHLICGMEFIDARFGVSTSASIRHNAASCSRMQPPPWRLTVAPDIAKRRTSCMRGSSLVHIICDSGAAGRHGSWTR